MFDINHKVENSQDYYFVLLLSEFTLTQFLLFVKYVVRTCIYFCLSVCYDYINRLQGPDCYA